MTLIPPVVLAVLITVSLYFGASFLIFLVRMVRAYRRPQTFAPGDAASLTWHLVVPGRDEEAVIGGTVSSLRERFPGAHVWMVDDASTDDTGAIVRALAAADPRVHLVSRRLPEARTGKGDALNAAVARIRSFIGDDDPGRHVVGVIDADGRLAPGALDVIAGPELFGDPAIGAVQVEVRMVNRTDRSPVPDAGPVRNFLARLLIRLQDVEFRGPINAQQGNRRRLNTVAMGGNGQFTRLSALLDLDGGDGRIWGGSLVEDFELGVHLLLAGWRTEHTSATHVEQEALWNLRRWLAQRTRWTQGNMQSARLLPALWRSPHLDDRGVLELTYYLLQPWCNLVGTVTFGVVPVVFLQLLWSGIEPTTAFVLWAAFLYLVLARFQMWVWGGLYRRSSGEGTWSQAVLWGLTFAPYTYMVYVTSWRAAWRMLRRRNGWAKTRRNAEALTGPVAREA